MPLDQPKNIINAEEMCLDCAHFIRPFLSKIWKCRFSMRPQFYQGEKGKLVAKCGCYCGIKNSLGFRYARKFADQVKKTNKRPGFLWRLFH